MASPDTLWAWYTAHAAMQSLGDGDPARQLDLLAQLPPNSFRNAHCANALKALAEHDPAAAEARLDLLTEPRSRARLQAEILGKTTERDPAAGLARLVALAPDLKVGSSGLRMVSQVMRSAAMRDAGAALRAVDELPEALQEQAVGAALVGWASEHPVDALAYAAANDITISEASAPMSMGDNFFGQQSLIHVALATDRAKTLAWLRTQP
ncbi:MAG TPA: hypothetical protein VGO90_14440, partial [Chthoniobacteraceae bacterium]|nr:hypothetical protein [Chthoniobacteraceae bacterium]